MKISNWVQQHRRSILFLIILLSIAGIYTIFKTPVALFPNVAFPRVLVSVDAGDQPAEQMQLEITKPIEEAIRIVPGIQSIRSTTTRGSASITINFQWGSDIKLKTLQLNNAITQIISTLPKQTSFSVRQMSPSAIFPILGYSLTSQSLSLTQLRTIAQYQLLPMLYSVPGVSKVTIAGGKIAEYHVEINPSRLALYGITTQDVAKALSTSNVLMAVGRLESEYQLYLLIADTRIHTINQIEHTIIHTRGTGLIELSDIATIKKSTVPQWLKVDANGKQAVLVQVFQQADANNVAITHVINKKMQFMQKQLLHKVQIKNWYDQSQLVIASADGVRNAIFIGVILASLIIYVFLKNLKVTFIAILVVPASLAITSLLLYALNMSFNIMTLGGMAAAIGLIIDDAIVMIEHIIRRLRQNPDHYHRRIMIAALTFTKPLTGSSAATTIIFLPLIFLQGVTGAFFKSLSLTMASALIVSYLVSLLAVPLLADHLLTLDDATHKQNEKWLMHCQNYYQRIMLLFLKKRYLLLIAVFVLFFIGFVAYEHVGTGFIPNIDEGGFNIDYKTLPGTSLTETNRVLLQVEKIIQQTPDVASFSRRTGLQFSGSEAFTEPNQGDFIVKLKSHQQKSTDEVLQLIRAKIEQKVPGIQVEFGQLMQDAIGDLTAVPQPIEIKIYSDDQNTLLRMAKKVAHSIATVSDVVDIRNGINPAGNALVIHISHAKAAIEGLNADEISQLLKTDIQGSVVTKIQEGNQMIGVRLREPKSLRDSIDELNNIMLHAPDGHLFPLKRVATIQKVIGQPELTRENLKPMIAVTARINGTDMGSVLNAIQQKLNEPNFFDNGSYYTLGGLYQQQQIAFHALLIVLVAAFALVFLLLLFLYEQFRIALAMICLPLLSMSSVFIGLWITGVDLNITSMMGMTMIVGIVTEAAIFYFSEYRELESEMSHNEALINAGVNRMRPIIMTTLAAILALLPLAVGLGNGASMEQPLAIAIISGLVLQLPFVLIVMPVFYDFLKRKTPLNSKQ